MTYPKDPRLEDLDRSRLRFPPYYFPRQARLDALQEMVLQLQRRLNLYIFAACLQSWHAHFLTGASKHDVGEVVKCAKDAITWKLRVGRPIWARGYGKRFCFDAHIARVRTRYVEKHNIEDGLPARPIPNLDSIDQHLPTT